MSKTKEYYHDEINEGMRAAMTEQEFIDVWEPKCKVSKRKFRRQIKALIKNAQRTPWESSQQNMEKLLKYGKQYKFQSFEDWYKQQNKTL